ncbi:MAG: DUF1636 domain-containing protein [Pseudomonadota bacterium]
MQADDHATLSVCTRCRNQADRTSDVERPGYRLAERIRSRFPDSEAARLGIALRGVRCMSQCKRPCVVALSCPQKFSLLFGDLNASTDVDAILHLSAQYAHAPDGLVLRRDRPEPLRAGILGRIPPLTFGGDLIDTDFTLPPTICKETL